MPESKALYSPHPLGRAVFCAIVWGIYSTVISAFFVAVLFFIGGRVLKAFNGDAGFIAAGIPLLRISLVSYLAQGAAFIIASLFQSVGKAAPAFVMSVVQGAVFIPMAFLSSGLFGFSGFAWALPAADVTTPLLGIGLFQLCKKAIYSETAPHENRSTAERKAAEEF